MTTTGIYKPRCTYDPEEKVSIRQMKEIENGFRKEPDDLKNAVKKAE